jgi:hypothetical protein
MMFFVGFIMVLPVIKPDISSDSLLFHLKANSFTLCYNISSGAYYQLSLGDYFAV